MSIVDLDQSRRRYLMQQVMRKVQGWQSIWMTSEFDQPCIAKGRYLAAKDFYEWLANGGDLAQARAYLEGRRTHWGRESETLEEMLFSLDLNDRIKKGFDTEESFAGWKHALTRGFDASDNERKQLKYLSVQHQASGIESQHLERLLRDPFVAGELNAPPAPPPPPVFDASDEDENDEPD